MTPSSLLAVLGSVLATLPLATIGCCPGDSNQPGPTWKVVVPASVIDGTAGGGATSAGGSGGAMSTGGAGGGSGGTTSTGGSGGTATQETADTCALCDAPTNCPTCEADGYSVYHCPQPVADDDGNYVLDCTTIRNVCIGGRRPSGLQDDSGPAIHEELGAYFAAQAHLEAASVTAFTTLRRELRALGAPSRLLRDAARAARDEVHHARLCASIAARRSRSATRRVVRVAAPPPRDAEAIAIENTIEGCVRETYAALQAHYQAHTATDPEVRSALLTIARDETRHAALSFTVARFLRGKLSPAARARVTSARTAAVARLRTEIAVAPSPSLRAAAGLPDAATAEAMLQGLERSLWRS